MKGNKIFLIDGRFLESMATGVDRYAFETIKELDRICGDAGFEVRLLVPDTVKSEHADTAAVVDAFSNIRVYYVKRGSRWTQVTFALHAWKMGAVPVNLCNEVSVMAPKGIVCLHDTCYADCPESSRKTKLSGSLVYTGELPKKRRLF